MSASTSFKRQKKGGQQGFSLIELMISLVLGLIVVGGAISIFVSNRQAYRASEGLARVQESARVAFEIMSNDVRHAGGNPCSNELPVANVLVNPTTRWWSDWGNGIRGYESAAAFADIATGTAVGNRVAGTDAVEIKTGVPTDIVVSGDMPDPSADIDVSATTGLQNSDIIMMCNFEQAALFQVTQAPAGNKIQHNTGTGTPGNCTKNIGNPNGQVVCSNANKGQPFTKDSVVAKLKATRWYIANNDRGGRSLYQSSLVNGGGVLSSSEQEVSDGVEDMQLQYLQKGQAAYKDADQITNWNDVTAVSIVLTLRSVDARLGTNSANQGKLQRTLSHVVGIRNHLP